MLARSTRSCGSPRAPLSVSLSRLMFLARSSDHRGERKRLSTSDSSKASFGSSRTPPPSSVRIAVCCISSDSGGRQLVSSSETMFVIDALSATCDIAQLPLSRQLGAAREEFVDRPCALAALANGPHDKRLPATRVASCKHLRDRGLVGFGVGSDVPARIVFDSKLVEHPRMDGVQIAHREQNKIDADLEARSRNFVQLPVSPFDAGCHERLELAVFALELLGLNCPIAFAAFLVRRRGAKLHWPIGPNKRLVFLLWRLRQ